MAFVSVKDSDKAVILPAVRQLIELGFTVIATGGTQRYLAEAGLPVEPVNKVAEGRPHIVDRIIDGDVTPRRPLRSLRPRQLLQCKKLILKCVHCRIIIISEQSRFPHIATGRTRSRKSRGTRS